MIVANYFIENSLSIRIQNERLKSLGELMKLVVVPDNLKSDNILTSFKHCQNQVESIPSNTSISNSTIPLSFRFQLDETRPVKEELMKEILEEI